MITRLKTGDGFTIVETLIFLAISGLMFVLAISAMSGKQQQTEFSTGVDILRSSLNQSLSNVSDGNYLALDNSGCTAGSTGAPSFTAAGEPDGSCTVIGEVIAFSTNTNGDGQQSYLLFPAIGRNFISSAGSTSQVAIDLSEALPQISSSVDQTETMPFGLSIVASPSTPTTLSSAGGYGALGLFSFTSFEGSNAANSSGPLVNSGSEHVEIFPIPASSLGDSAATVAANIDNNGLTNCGSNNSKACVGNNPPANINPSAGVTFCVDSGSNAQSALFTIGGSNGPSTATDQIYSKLGC